MVEHLEADRLSRAGDQEMNKKNLAVHGFILLTAIVARLYFVPSHQEFRGDEKDYHVLACSLAEGKSYRQEGGDLGEAFLKGERDTYSRPPFYPLFIAWIYRLFGIGNLKAVYLFQVLLGALVCSLVYAMTKPLFGKRAAFLAAVLTAVNPSLASSSSRLLTESLFTFCLVAAFFFLQRKTKAALIFAGIFLSLTVLTKGVALFLPFTVAGIFIARNRWEGVSQGAILIGVCFLTIVPLVIRNYREYHTLIPVSTQGGYAFYNSYHPEKGKIFGTNVKDERTLFADRLGSETEKSNYLFQKTLEDIRKNPLSTLRLELLKFLYFWVPFDWEILGRGRYHLIYGFIFPFFILGMAWAEKDRLLLAVPVFYFLAMALIFYGSPRFRLPVEPFIIIFGAFGLLEVFRRIPRRSLGWMCVATLLVIHAGLAISTGSFKRYLANSLHSVGLW